MTLSATEPRGPGPRAALAWLRGLLHGARWTFRFSRAALLVGLALVLLSPLLVLNQEITAPSWLRDRVERAAAEALGGGAVRFEEILVRLPPDLHPEVRLIGVTLSDREGRQVARVPEVDLQVSPRGVVLARRLLVQEIVLRGAELSLARARDGSVALAFGGGGAQPRGVRADGLLSVPDQFERLFERPALEALREVRVEGLVVNYADARAGRSWTVDGGALALDLSGGMTRLSGEASLLSGRAYVSRARIDYSSPRGSPAASLSLTVTDVAAADVASQSPALTWLDVVDAPISLALRASLDGEGALGPASVALKIAGGELRPGGAEGVPFEAANAYLSWDPGAQAVRFDRVEVRSDWGGVTATGAAFLREAEDGLPRAMLGQFEVSDLTLDPPDLYPEALHLPAGSAQFRLRLDPFEVEVAEASLALPGGDGAWLHLSGEVGASPEGWRLALDAAAGELARDRVLELWPESFRPGVRWWVDEYLTAGTLEELSAALRVAPGQAPRMAVTGGFSSVAVRPLLSHPPIAGAAGRITWDGATFTAALDRGRVAAPQGGTLDLAGTGIAIRPGDAVRSPATVTLAARGPVTAALSLLDMAPWRLVSPSGLPVDMAAGRAEARGTLDLFIGPMTAAEFDYDVAATLRGVRSDVVVPGWTLAADALELAVTPAGVRIAGPARLGDVPVEGAWAMGFGPEELGRSTVEARVPVTTATLAGIGVALPEGSVAGEGLADVTVTLGAGAPDFAVRSDLRGLRLAVPEIGWSKRPDAAGALLVEGHVETPVAVDRLSVEAPGLSAEGELSLTASGAFEELALSELKVGDWLDAAVRLTAREGSDTPAVAVEGGTLDLAKAEFGTGGEGEGGPVAVALDRLAITEGIALTGFVGEFSTVAGLEGGFAGQVNGGPPVTGRVAPQAGRVAARIQGPDAGAVLKAADIFTRAEGGALDMLLTPAGEASYEGQLWVTGLKVTDAPVLASLLNAASGIGLLQQLGGQGIVFDQVAADFRIDPTRVIVERSSAVGAGLGLSADGVFDTEAYWMDFRGVVSPFYLVNAIGSVLTRPGEGLFGFNYTLKGSPDDPQVGVNPLSVLTPGMFREVFRAAPP